jgi:quinol monooxygenase YgiN
MSVTAILDLQFKPDAVEEGLAIFRRILVDTRAFAGCESVSVIQDRDDPTRVLAIEVWESAEADAKYRAWRAGDGAIPDLPGVLAGAPRTTVGEVLADV